MRLLICRTVGRVSAVEWAGRVCTWDCCEDDDDSGGGHNIIVVVVCLSPSLHPPVSRYPQLNNEQLSIESAAARLFYSCSTTKMNERERNKHRHPVGQAAELKYFI